MKIGIVGCGALGCLVAALLKQKAKADVIVVEHAGDRAKKICQDGLRVEGASGSFTVKVAAVSDAKEAGACDLVIVGVKSYSTEDACKDIKELVGSSTSILTMQNGIGNIQILNDHFGPEKIVGGVTNHGATLIGTGHVRHAGKGDTIIGRSDGRVLGAVRDIAVILTKCGIEAKVSKDIDAVIWSKLVVNVGINALTAIARLHNGMLLEREECRQVMRSAVQEVVKVVKRKRIKLLYDDPIQKVESVCKLTSHNVSSMLQDVLAGKRTEIDFINGAVVRQAKALNIPTPVNETLTNIVKIIESNYGNVVTRCV